MNDIRNMTFYEFIILRFDLGKNTIRGIVGTMFAREKIAGLQINPPEPRITHFARSREGMKVFPLERKRTQDHSQFRNGMSAARSE